MKTYSVKLKVYRGKKSYDEHGNMTSANQSMDLSPYLSMEWNKWMENATLVGYTGAEVLKVCDIVHTEHTERDGKKVEPYNITTHEPVKNGDPIVDEIKVAVKKAFIKTPEIALTPEQQKMADMQAEMDQLKAMIKGGNTAKPASKAPKVNPVVTETELEATEEEADVDDIDELEDLRAEWFELTGKNADKRWKEGKLKEEIEKLKND